MAGTWQNSDLITHTQADWGGDPGMDAGAVLLVASYDTVYASNFGVVTVGSAGGFTMSFTDAASVVAYQPSIGPFAPLNGSVLNPISTASGGFGGEVLGLEFNVDFSDAGFLPGTTGLLFGDLILANFKPIFFSPFNGLTVRQFLGDVNILLGGGTTTFTIADLGTLVGDLNASFSAGTPSTFAQDHLIAPAAANPVPEPTTWMLLTTAFLGLACIRRRRWPVLSTALSACILAGNAIAGTSFGPIDGPIFTGGVETDTGGIDAFNGVGLRALYCDPTATLPVDFCASLAYQTTPQPAFTAALKAYPRDLDGISHNATFSRASGEMVYFFAVVGPLGGPPIPLTISTFWQADYTPTTTLAFGAPQPGSSFTYSAGIRVDAVNRSGVPQSVTQDIGPGFIPGNHSFNVFAMEGTQYDIALILAPTTLTNFGIIQAGDIGIASAQLLVDPIISFAPGFDSTGYSIVVSDGVSNGVADAPEPSTGALIGGALALLLAMRRNVAYFHSRRRCASGFTFSTRSRTAPPISAVNR